MNSPPYEAQGLLASVCYTYVGSPSSEGVVAYRKDTEQRRLACVLETDHGHVHLRRPVAPCQPRHWERYPSTAMDAAIIASHNRLTRRSLAASRTPFGIALPWLPGITGQRSSRDVEGMCSEEQRGRDECGRGRETVNPTRRGPAWVDQRLNSWQAVRRFGSLNLCGVGDSLFTDIKCLV